MGSRYTGRSSPRVDLILRDGRPISSRAISKIRNAECGQRYAMEDLIRAGARAPRLGEDRGEWLASLERTGFLTRRRHPGCRSEEHTSELQSLMLNSYAVFCLKKKKTTTTITQHK